MSTNTTPGHLNSRTRKRFRDGRPDEEIIHQNTISMLYAAQKKQGATGSGLHTNGHAIGHDRDPTPTIPAHHSSTSMSPPSRKASNVSMSSDSASQLSTPFQTQKEKAQRSLESFFTSTHGPGPGKPMTSSPHHSKDLNPQPIRDHSLSPNPIPLWHGTQIPAVILPELASVLTCEDCFAPLLTATYRNLVDTEMMDVDGPVIDCEVDEGWQCVRCRKRVCDTCAVRDNERVCLECANPGNGMADGNGRYGGMGVKDAGEKRWVGGIGWM